jgi:hypothetical protein
VKYIQNADTVTAGKYQQHLGYSLLYRTLRVPYAKSVATVFVQIVLLLGIHFLLLQTVLLVLIFIQYTNETQGFLEEHHFF